MKSQNRRRRGIQHRIVQEEKIPDRHKKKRKMEWLRNKMNASGEREDEDEKECDEQKYRNEDRNK